MTTIAARRQSFITPLRLIAAVAAPFFVLIVFRLAIFSGGEMCVDCFYHSAIADQGPSLFTQKTFPAMTMSTWKDCFYDKELGWHFVLWIVQKTQKAVGVFSPDSFTVQTLFFDLAALCAFVFAARRLGLSSPLLFSMLLVVVSPLFTGRLLMLRPHVVSIAFVMLSLPFFSSAKNARGLAPIFLLSFAYSWCYSNPHLLLLPAAAFAVFRLLRGEKASVAMPFVAAAGMIAGMTLHPQFPNTFAFWKIQCADVVLNSLAGAWISPSREMTPMKPGEIPVNALLFAIFAFNIALACVVWKKKGLSALSADSLSLLSLSAVFLGGLFFSVRPVEYACPFAVLSFGLLLRDFKKCGLTFPGRPVSKYLKVELALLFAALAAANMFYLELVPRNKPFSDFRQWAAANLHDGDLVANLAWSDFPQLFHAAPNLRYLSGLDPLFLYRRDPAKALALDNFCRKGKLTSPSELRAVVDADLAFISCKHKVLAGEMLKRGFVPLRVSADGWLFSLRNIAPR